MGQGGGGHVGHVLVLPGAAVAVFSPSASGMLVFQTGASAEAGQMLNWTDLENGGMVALGEPGQVYHPIISPDGTRAVVEVRNASLLDSSYFDMLEGNGVAHVYNQWQRMPNLDEQLALRAADNSRAPVGARLLLKAGRQYQEAVDTFQPYDRIQEPQPAVRTAAVKLVRRGMDTDDILRRFRVENPPHRRAS